MKKLIALAMLELVFVNSSDGMYTSGNLSVEADQNLTQGVGTFRARQSRKSWTKEAIDASFIDLDLTVKIILNQKVDFLKKNGKIICELTLKALNYYS